MKKAITSLMALMVSLTITLAGTKGNGFGNSGTPQPSNGGSQQIGAHIVHYTSSYTDPFFGSVTCTGVHQTGKNFGPQGQDSFTCTAQPAGAALQNVTPNETITLSTFGGWYSDYYNLPSLGSTTVLALAFNGVVSSDGTSYTAVANY
jgi:hypothetical protein